MPFRTVALSAISDTDVARWCALATRAVEPNPFAEPEFVLPLEPVFEGADDRHIAVVEDDGAWKAAMVFRAADHRLVRAHYRTIELDRVHAPTFRTHPLIGSAAPAKAWAALFDGMRRESLPPLLNLGFFPADGALHDSLMEVALVSSMRWQDRREDEWAWAAAGRPAAPVNDLDEWLASLRDCYPFLNRHAWQGVRRAARRAQAQASGPLTYVDRSDDPSAINDFIRLQAAGWKGVESRGGAAIALVPGYAEAFQRIAGAFRVDGRFRLSAIMAGGATLHMACALRARSGGWFGLLDAYDEEYAAASPGRLGRLLMSGALAGDFPHDPFDPGVMPDYQSAVALFPDRRRYVYRVLSYGGRSSNALLRSLPALEHAAAAAKRARTVPAP